MKGGLKMGSKTIPKTEVKIEPIDEAEEYPEEDVNNDDVFLGIADEAFKDEDSDEDETVLEVQINPMEFKAFYSELRSISGLKVEPVEPKEEGDLGIDVSEIVNEVELGMIQREDYKVSPGYDANYGKHDQDQVDNSYNDSFDDTFDDENADNYDDDNHEGEGEYGDDNKDATNGDYFDDYTTIADYAVDSKVNVKQSMVTYKSVFVNPDGELIKDLGCGLPQIVLFRLDQTTLNKFLCEKKLWRATMYLRLMKEQQKDRELAGKELAEDRVEELGKDLSCNICGKDYPTPKAVRRHKREVHLRVFVQTCDQCDYVGPNKQAIYFHTKIVHEGQFRYICPLCDKFKIQKRVAMVKHLKTEHDIKDEDMKTHIKSQFKKRIPKELRHFECKECKFVTKDKYTHTKHMRKYHAIEKSEIIEQMGSCQTTPDGLFMCPQCPKTFKKRVGLNFHFTRLHRVSPPPEDGRPESWNTCDQCGYYASSRFDLARHKRKEHPVMLMCDKCDFMAKTKQTLSDHYNRTHDKVERFFCESCPEGFYTKAELKYHCVYTHGMKAKTFKCPQTVSPRVKPTALIQCEQCSYSSLYKNKVDEHNRRVHLGEKNYKCEYCDFRGFSLPETYAHTKSKHLKIFRYNCDLCLEEGIKFGVDTRYRYHRHLRYKHGVENPFDADTIKNARPLKHPRPTPKLKDRKHPNKWSRGRKKAGDAKPRIDPESGEVIEKTKKSNGKSKRGGRSQQLDREQEELLHQQQLQQQQQQHFLSMNQWTIGTWPAIQDPPQQ